MSTAMPISELRLRELSAEPAEDLFPVMNSGPAFAPWIVVLAFLPALAGVMNWSLDDRSADWGLHALAAAHPVADADTVQSGTAAAAALAGSPPLMTWLTALLLSRWKLDLPWGLAGISYLAAAGTILSAARLAKRLGTPRLASLTALCCAGSALLLNSAHLGSPEALGLCLMTFSFERFLAHLDSSVGGWSWRLLVSAVAWGGCWLAIGWPALCLGMALAIHAPLFSNRMVRASPAGEFAPVGLLAMRKYRSSLLVWWLIGLPIGLWGLWPTIQSGGMTAAFWWLFQSAPHAASPLFPRSSEIIGWGGSVGATFLLGWILLGVVTLIQRPPGIVTATEDGRHIVLLLWWIALMICRIVTAASGADPTPWDLLQVVPACVTAAVGMESVLRRSISAGWLACGILVGIASVMWHASLVETREMYAAVTLATVVALAPLLRNLWDARSGEWNERQRRRALRGLVLSTWLGHLGWGVAQSLPDSQVDARLASQLTRVGQSIAEPGALVVVSPSAPSRTLIFQLRRQWPDVLLVTSDRWESAISRTLSSIDNWADAEFLVVELTRRDSQFRRPGAGWIVTPVGEPRRYYDDQLSLHRVSLHSP